MHYVTLLMNSISYYKVFAAKSLMKVILVALCLCTQTANAQLRPVIPANDSLFVDQPLVITPIKTAKGKSTTRPSSRQLAEPVVTGQLVDGQQVVETYTVEGVTFRMIKVAGGTFMMGGTEEQGTDAYDEEKPVHAVTLPDYYIGETEVTQQLWEAMVGHNPSHFKGKDRPVECVRYIDIDLFLMKLEYYTGKRFRLPSEQEWEFAARGGNLSRHTKYAGSENFDSVAWYCNNSANQTHDVKGKAPNELGIYDMSGNVEEWCEDTWRPYTAGADEDTDETARVSRGGGYLDFAKHLRVSDRRRVPITIYNSDIGLRLVR